MTPSAGEQGTRWSAVQALGKLEHSELLRIVPSLLVKLTNSDPLTRQAAVQGLGQLSPLELGNFMPHLMTLLLEDPDANVRKYAIITAGKMQNVALEGLVTKMLQVLEHPEEEDANPNPQTLNLINCEPCQ